MEASSSSGAQFSCPSCDKKFDKVKNLKTHFAMHLSRDSKTISKCTYCNKTFSQHGNLKRHVNHVHLKISESLTDSTTMPVKSFACEKCQAQFSNISLLKQHVSTTHNTNSTIWRCSFCEQLVSSKHLIHRHVQTHSGEKCFTCQNCLANFGNLKLLNEHAITCKNSVLCVYCDKKYGTKTELKTHLATVHTGKDFTLFKHQLSLRSTVFECQQCDLTFPTAFKLSLHQTNHVNNARVQIKKEILAKNEAAKKEEAANPIIDITSENAPSNDVGESTENKDTDPKPTNASNDIAAEQKHYVANNFQHQNNGNKTQYINSNEMMPVNNQPLNDKFRLINNVNQSPNQSYSVLDISNNNQLRQSQPQQYMIINQNGQRQENGTQVGTVSTVGALAPSGSFNYNGDPMNPNKPVIQNQMSGQVLQHNNFNNAYYKQNDLKRPVNVQPANIQQPNQRIYTNLNSHQFANANQNPGDAMNPNTHTQHMQVNMNLDHRPNQIQEGMQMNVHANGNLMPQINCSNQFQNVEGMNKNLNMPNPNIQNQIQQNASMQNQNMEAASIQNQTMQNPNMQNPNMPNPNMANSMQLQGQMQPQQRNMTSIEMQTGINPQANQTSINQPMSTNMNHQMSQPNMNIMQAMPDNHMNASLQDGMGSPNQSMQMDMTPNHMQPADKVEKTVEKVLCPHCSKTYSKNYLKRHVQKAHAEDKVTASNTNHAMQMHLEDKLTSSSSCQSMDVDQDIVMNIEGNSSMSNFTVATSNQLLTTS